MMRTMLCSFAGRAMTIRDRRYRLFCRLDYDARDRAKPLLVVICGLDKPFRTQLSAADYRQVRDLGAEYLRRNPRSLA